MLGFTTLNALPGWTVKVFIGGYVAIYAGQALVDLMLLLQTIRQLKQSSLPAGSPQKI